MSIRLQDISPSPINQGGVSSQVPNLSILPNYVPQGSLASNLNIFKKRVHTKLFLAKMAAFQYTLNTDLSIQFSGTNKTEQQNVNQISQDAANEAVIIGEEVAALISNSLVDIDVSIHTLDTPTPAMIGPIPSPLKGIKP